MRNDGRRFGVGPMAVCLLCVARYASTSWAQQAPEDRPACVSTLDGQVVDAASHEVIAGAVIRVDGVIVAATDEAGRFQRGALCPGELTIEAQRAGYVAGRRTIPISGEVSLELELQAVPPEEGEVIAISGEAPKEVDMRSTAVISGDALDRTRGRGLADVLAEVPGVSQLRAASGLAKPIIRGQYGRRLVILVDGVRHRAQEWGLDHAPEIDPFIADKITVVRGASGVRYGPDAIGGAVLVDPPELLDRAGLAAVAHLIGVSNGRGGSFAGRLQGAPAGVPGLAWQVEGSVERQAAPSTPDYPLDNTGADIWNVGATTGYRTAAATYKLSYLRHQARLGVCSCLRIESSDDFYAQLAADEPAGADLYRSDFEIERPYQAVVHDLGIARGRWSLGSIGTIDATYAFQHDRRREYDIVRQATTAPQFDFRLITHELDVALVHHPLHLNDRLHLRGTVGFVGLAQVHAYGGLPLVPDHRAWGAGVYAIERLIGPTFELEAGVRYDALARTASIARQDYLRLVRSDQIAMDACDADADAEAGDPVACASTFHTFSASLGGLRQLTDAWSIKLDLSTASRPPDPDEQYLNGTSPTFPALGLGKPDLGPETTYSASTTTAFHGDRVTAEASVYANAIADYIYFAPAIDEDGQPIFDVLIRGTFPRFATRAVDAVFYGADGGIAVAPLASLELGAQLSMVRARNTSDDSYLVFVPADRLRASATYKPPDRWGLNKSFVSLSGTFVARQDRFDLAADLAPPPAAYLLLGAEVGTETAIGGHTVKVALQGSNLLNARYRDYTSLLRYFADQPGWQVLARLSFQLVRHP